jgi:uncharacterized membrane protein (UPF0127 family)
VRSRRGRVAWLLFVIVVASCADPGRLMTEGDTDALVTVPDGSEDDGPMGFVDRGEVPDDFPLAVVEVSGRTWVVAVAADSDRRYRGLRGVADLGDLDGMLFVWDEDATAGFGMLSVPIPLDIAWFDEAGTLVGTASMTPCPARPCTSYRPPGPYRHALETTGGGFDGLEPLTLVLNP